MFRFTSFFQLTALILSFLLPTQVLAECMYIDLTERAAEIPYFIQGTVTKVSSEEELSKCLSEKGNNPDGPCLYEFTISLSESLKGQTDQKQLTFSYPYWLGCPGVDTFTVGDAKVFAIKSIEKGGKAELAFHSCGYSGIDMNDNESLNKLKNRLRQKR